MFLNSVTQEMSSENTYFLSSQLLQKSKLLNQNKEYISKSKRS